MKSWAFQYIKRGHPETLGGFADSRKTYLRALRALQPVLRELCMLYSDSSRKKEKLEEDLENLRPWVLKYGWDPKADPRCFSELNEQGSPTADSTSRVGFSFSLVPEVFSKSSFLASFSAGTSTSARSMPRNRWGRAGHAP